MPTLFEQQALAIDSKLSDGLNSIFYNRSQWKTHPSNANNAYLKFKVDNAELINQHLAHYLKSKGIGFNISLDNKEDGTVVRLCADINKVKRLLAIDEQRSSLVDYLNQAFYHSNNWHVIDNGPFVKFMVSSKTPFVEEQIAHFFQHHPNSYSINTTQKGKKYVLSIIAHSNDIAKLLHLEPQTLIYNTKSTKIRYPIPVTILDSIIDKALYNEQYHKTSLAKENATSVVLKLSDTEYRYRESIEQRLPHYLRERGFDIESETGYGFGLNRNLTMLLPSNFLQSLQSKNLLTA